MIIYGTSCDDYLNLLLIIASMDYSHCIISGLELKFTVMAMKYVKPKLSMR